MQSVFHAKLLLIGLFVSFCSGAEDFFSEGGFESLIKKCEKSAESCATPIEKFEYGFVIVSHRGDTNKGWLLIEESANEGHLPAIYFNVERYYRQLDGKELNTKLLNKYANLAISKLNSIKYSLWKNEDLVNLSFIYETGVSGSTNLVKAFQLVEEASKRGHLQAKYQLARMYKMGIGVVKDEKVARKLHKELVKEGYYDKRS